MSEKEGIIMICRKCGCMLESGTRICPFCGEPATLAASPVVEGLPELVLLNELAPVPATREETLKELRRLESYFGELDTKYATLADLWLKSACWQAPSKVRWAVGGFLLALLLYLLVGIHLPAMAVWIFVVLWGVIAYFGYSRSCAHYASGLSANERAIREIENTIRPPPLQRGEGLLPAARLHGAFRAERAHRGPRLWHDRLVRGLSHQQLRCALP